MNEKLRILLLEDNFSDAELIQRELRKFGFDFEVRWAENKAAFLDALDTFVPDILLADYALPGFDGMAALSLARRRFEDIPLILVSGAIGEETAIECLKAGATDYVLKQRLKRLGTVIRRALLESEQLTERKRAEEALRQAKDELEHKVRERTAELVRTVDTLQEEIAQRRRAEDDVRLANAQLQERAVQLRALARQLTVVESRERNRIAKILHDHLQQQLASAKLQVTWLDQLTGDDLALAAARIEDILSEAIKVSRSLTAELSPPILHEAGLEAGLEWLVRRMLDEYALRVDLTVDDRSELDEDVRIMLFESVRELLFNVVKHAKVSWAEVRVQPVDETGMLITVRDEGVGFDPLQLKPSGDNYPGFGLFTIQERIDLIGGHLKISSALEKGSCFSLLVPYAHQAAAPLSGASYPEPAQTCAETVLEDEAPLIRVLIADDHAIFRDGIARLLNRERDIQVVAEAGSGREAVELARKTAPDLILMDISMPEVNGIEATRIICRESPDIRIIGFSMYEDEERSLAILKAGAVGHKTKGCAASDLLEAIRRCMRAKSVGGP
ncbi:MAG: response regulator [Deltaproteobacteria bacterium]|nr:response regulator [Deltaproteobacteria bacterium]